MQSEIKIGQRFKFILSDKPSQERQAIVTRVLSNSEEGLGPEVGYYLAYWSRLTNFQKQRLQQRWCSSAELTGTYIWRDVRLPSHWSSEFLLRNIDLLSTLPLR